MKYRITVEQVVEPSDDNKYPNYPELYQQTVEQLDVHDLAVYINDPLRLRVAESYSVPVLAGKATRKSAWTPARRRAHARKMKAYWATKKAA